ncbi:MAG: DNA-directed polymerase subunit omega [Actinomycetota bacterium]
MSTEDVMMSPPIEELMDRTHSKFALVTLSARRAREINSYFNQLGEGLGTMVPPQVSSVSRKPLSISFEEIAADKIKSVEMKVYDEFAAEADAALLDEAAEELQAGLEGGEDAVAAEPTAEVAAEAEPAVDVVAEPTVEEAPVDSAE